MAIIEILNMISPLPEICKNELEAIIFENKYPKGYQLLRLWQVSNHMHFIVQGSGRIYYLRDGHDVTDYLALEGQFIGGVESLFTHEPSHKAIELTENSTVKSFLYSDFEKLCQRYHDIERLGRKMAIFAFLEGQRRIEAIRFLSAAERYQELERKYPGISNRIPLKYLASYLGTTQVSLSRIRSGIQ
jgi:CRP-like cAMP-binding protein